MSNPDRTLDFYQSKLEDLERDYNDTNEKLRGELNPSTKNALERDRQRILKEINILEKNIAQHKSELKSQLVQDSIESLSHILQNREDLLTEIVLAYKTTIPHWPVRVHSGAHTVDEILAELEKITKGKLPYTAQEEFIAHLVSITTDTVLANSLNQWSEDYRNGRNWLELHHQIQEIQDERLKEAQPAIFLDFAYSDASPQGQTGENLYQMKAWLIKDVEVYQTQNTGVHPLILPETPEAAPKLLEVLEQEIPHLIQNFLIQAASICENCRNFAEIHVFLPLELIHWGLDICDINPEPSEDPKYLGRDRIVLIRCANRYMGSYQEKARWLKIWDNWHQALLQSPAKQGFILGSDDDLDTLIEQLYHAVKDLNRIDAQEKSVGLCLTQAPSDAQQICKEVLKSGLPLAIWSRENLLGAVHAMELTTLLSNHNLGELPRAVQEKRNETCMRRNTRESHIGHHLSLLWDNPYLRTPKTLSIS
jgi:hypothetical protein